MVKFKRHTPVCFLGADMCIVINDSIPQILDSFENISILACLSVTKFRPSQFNSKEDL